MNKAKYLNDVLTNMEAEEIISKNLKNISLLDYGSELFIKQHAYLERINMQSVKNALMGGDDFILENFVTYEKIKPLIEELFVAFHFKKYIYPKIKREICETSSMKVYILIYHEAVLVNIVEHFFYHVTACQAAEDYIIDIIEYAYSKLSKLIERKEKTAKNENNVDEMDLKLEELEFTISMACISILRYITDHLDQLPFPVRNHIMNVKDIPLLLVALMDEKPYKKVNSAKTEIFENNQWVSVDLHSNKLPKLEAQLWIAIFNLLMSQDNTKKYEITDFRKNTLLRLRKYMNESLYDQIPPLQQLYRNLEEMSLIDHSGVSSSNPFIVEMIPTLFTKKYSEENVKLICDKIVKEYFNNDPLKMKKEMEFISEIYSISNMEYFMDDPKCCNCGKDAMNRCSKCKSEWYCGKDCQIKRWKKHKEICSNLAEMNKEIELNKNTNETKKEEMTIVKSNEINKEIIKDKIKLKEFDELD